jgi:hypothetical protein
MHIWVDPDEFKEWETKRTVTVAPGNEVEVEGAQPSNVNAVARVDIVVE